LVDASAGGLLVPEGLYSPVAKYLGICFKVRMWIELSRKVNFINLFQNEGLSPSCIALPFDGFGSISWYCVFNRLFHSFHFFFEFPAFSTWTSLKKHYEFKCTSVHQILHLFFGGFCSISWHSVFCFFGSLLCNTLSNFHFFFLPENHWRDIYVDIRIWSIKCDTIDVSHSYTDKW
jgi:hypothetical protein